MSDGDAAWAGQLAAFTTSNAGFFLRRQMAQQDRRVEESNAVWQGHHDVLVDRFNRLAADHEALLSWATAAAEGRDAALARVATLEAQLAEERDRHAFALEVARSRADGLDGQVEALLRMRREGR